MTLSGHRAAAAAGRMSAESLLGWDLDDVLEGYEQVPAVYVRDATNTAVTLPPLTEPERAVDADQDETP